MSERIDVQGVLFDSLTMDGAVSRALELIAEKRGACAVTPNPEIVWLCGKDEQLKNAVNRADLILADGIGVILAAKLQGIPLKQKLPGIDFACALMERLAEDKKSVYLLGAKPGIAEKAGEYLVKSYPGLKLAAAADGYFLSDGPIISDICEKRPELLLVCLGSPKQELWMSKYKCELPIGLMVGLGGSLDVFAGAVKRAPPIWRRLGLEWLYRLIREPSRLPRMLRLPLFLLKTVFGGARK